MCSFGSISLFGIIAGTWRGANFFPLTSVMWSQFYLDIIYDIQIELIARQQILYFAASWAIICSTFFLT